MDQALSYYVSSIDEGGGAWVELIVNGHHHRMRLPQRDFEYVCTLSKEERENYMIEKTLQIQCKTTNSGFQQSKGYGSNSATSRRQAVVNRLRNKLTLKQQQQQSNNNSSSS